MTEKESESDDEITKKSLATTLSSVKCQSERELIMAITMCPGQNMAFWRPGDIFDIVCPNCGGSVEFFKDDARRRCQSCNHVFSNPKLNEGCAAWCKFADKCLGLNDEVRLD